MYTYIRKEKRRYLNFSIRNKKLNVWPHPLPFVSLSPDWSPDSYFRETVKLPLPLIDTQTIDYTELRLTEKRSIIYGILWCTVIWHGGRQLPQPTDSTWMYEVHSQYTKIPPFSLSSQWNFKRSMIFKFFFYTILQWQYLVVIRAHTITILWI